MSNFKDNQIYFTVNKGKVKLSFKRAIPFTDFLQIISTGILSQMNAIIKSTPEEQKAEVQEDLYDMYNAAASNTLAYFAPNIEMRPHLTSEAILKAEDALLNQVNKNKKKEAK